MTQHKDHSMIAFLTSLLTFVAALGVIYALTHSCGPAKSGGKPSPAAPPPPPPPEVTCEGIQLGSLRKVACPDGQTGDVTQVCQKNPDGTIGTWNPQFDTCAAVVPPPPPPPPGPPPPPTKKPCDDVVTFDELSPVIALNCASCHPGRDTYAQAKSVSAAMNERIAITSTSDPRHMPAGRASLSAADQALFTGWARDGFLAAGDCQGSTPPPVTYHDLAWAEQTMFADVERQPSAEQPNTRYLTAVDQLNLGRSTRVALAKAAGSKAANSVSTERGLFPLVDVAPGIWRINIDQLGIQAAEWKVIEDASQLNLESFTVTGVALKAVTKSRLFAMNVDDFNDTVLRNAAVYYRVTEAAATLPLELAKLGVDFAGDLLNKRAALVGFNGSHLAPAANRLISRHRSTDGAFYASYDTGPVLGDPAKNVFNSPLLVEAGGKANLVFAAGEQLFTLPNGLIGSFLANAAGQRLDFADPNVVHDFTSNPVSPFIRNAVSCSRCHNGGYIRAKDEVRASLATSGLAALDAQIAAALFKPQGEVDQLFDADNARFSSALAQLGIDSTQPDPISVLSDIFLGDHLLDAVAYRLWMRPEELALCLNQSPNGRLQAGQLLGGGTISHDQLIQVVGDLKRDCRLLQDPL